MPNTQPMTLKATSIDLPGLRALREGEAEFALFDVREAGEAHRGHLFGATFLPRRQLEMRIAELVPRIDTPVVVYDGGNGDRRAQRAAQTLHRLGYANARALEGGTAAWVAAGHTLSEGSNVPSKLFGEEVYESEHVPRLPVQDLRRWQEEGRPHLVCDIRSPQEYARSRIPGARGAFGTDLALLAGDLRAAGMPVVVHCSGRTRSIIACQGLRELGVPQAYALEDGTMGWQLAGFELERDAGAGVLPPSAASAAAGEAAARRLGEQAGATAMPRGRFDALMQARSAGRANLYPIDVRQLDEYAAGHVPGSVAVPGGPAIQRTDEFMPVRTAPIVLIDRLEARAWLAAYWLRRMGLPHVHVLEGGVSAWGQAGRALATGRERSVPAGFGEARGLAQTILPDALRALGPAALVACVDTSREFSRARLPGSAWIRYGDLEERVGAMPAADHRRLVLACRDGVLSTLGAANLVRMQVAGVRVLAGGLRAWENAGYPVETGSGPGAQPAGDLVTQPYDSGREGMQRYLDWEKQLTGQRPQHMGGMA